MKTLIASVLLGVTTSSFAYEITDFSVFSKSDITYARSDFEGMTGAGGSINVEDFSFVRGEKNGIFAGEKFKHIRGQANTDQMFVGSVVQLQNVLFRGDIRAFGVALDYTTINGKLTANYVNSTQGYMGYPTSSYYSVRKISRGYAEDLAENLRLDLISLGVSLDTFSKECKELVSTEVKEAFGKLAFSGSKDMNIFEVTAADLATASEVLFNVPFTSTVVINVSGDYVEIQNKGLRLNGADPKKIIWNIFEAKTMILARSGSKELINGRAAGLPGIFVAPFADTSFHEAVITGSLWVNSLKGNSVGRNGGQVNDGLFAGRPCRRIVTGGKH